MPGGCFCSFTCDLEFAAGCLEIAASLASLVPVLVVLVLDTIEQHVLTVACHITTSSSIKGMAECCDVERCPRQALALVET